MGRRADARAGCKAVLDAYKTANTDSSLPIYLAHVYDHPPPRVTGRSAWVNKEVPEQISFGANIQSRVFQPSITVVNKLASSDQAADEQDAIEDEIIRVAMTVVRTAVSGCVLLPASSEDVEITADDGIYAGLRVTFNLLTQGGRTP